MSVLINMEMPTSCRACPMKMNCDDCEGWECVCVPLHEQIGYLDELLTDKRRDDCPLIPVPPHGRLIESDYLYNAVEQRYRMSSGIEHRCERDLLDVICGAPTIIPAEEGET